MLDCFIGSGTTAVSCKQLGRNFIGFEIEKSYCDVADKRLSQNSLFDVMQPLDVKQQGGRAIKYRG